jgi:energy-coupling factor transport system ATP-binding protein
MGSMGMLRAEAVGFAFPQAGHGLAPVSLQVEPGQTLFISGASGCGKSTLARCLSGLIPHLYHGNYRGRVWLDGLQADRAPLWALSEQVGLVFQNPAAQMLATTVEEEILFGLENLGLEESEAKLRLEQALHDFELDALRRRSPQTLSGGEQQKLALAALTARRPPFLVLDEPLSMLDTTAARDFIAALNQHIKAGTGVVVCEHRQESLQGLPNLQQLELDGKTGTTSTNEPENWPAGEAADWSLEVNDLAVRRSGRLVLNRLSFAIPGGKLAALVGRNGAGKTTLLRALAGLQPFAGQIQIREGSRTTAPDFGLVFQNADLQLFNATVKQEILFRIDKPDLKLYATLIQALDLEEYQQTPPLLLSEGEKRRVALATVLMRQARHGVLLDEPALGQDALHKQQLVRTLRQITHAGQFVIYSTHDIELAMQADLLFLLHPEGIITGGPPAQVLADRAAWQKLGLLIPEWLEP